MLLGCLQLTFKGLTWERGGPRAGCLQSLRTFLGHSAGDDVQAIYDAVDSLFPSPPQSLLPPLLLDSHDYHLLNESHLQSHPQLTHSPHRSEDRPSKNCSLSPPSDASACCLQDKVQLFKWARSRPAYLPTALPHPHNPSLTGSWPALPFPQKGCAFPLT